MDAVINHNIIHVLPTASVLFQSVAENFVQHAIAVVNKKQFFSVVLSGGETPKFFFDALVKISQIKSIPWQQIKFFFGDERYVSSQDAASNYHLANEHLFSKVPIPVENIYRIPTEFNDPHVAAENYAHTLQKVFNHAMPQFDLVYLGLGEDGHTASLMPGSDVIRTYLDAEKIDLLVAALWVPALKQHRITLTPNVLNNSRHICFLVTGANKALVVSEVLKGSFKPLKYPAQLIQCVHGQTVWYLDQAAASEMSTAPNPK